MDAARIAELAQRAAEVAPVDLPKHPGTDLHVDGDYAAYYFAGNDDTTTASSKRSMIDNVLTAADVGGVGGQTIIHLSAQLGDKGKRFKIATVKPYQGQRDSSRRPKNWQFMRDWMEAGAPGTDWRVIKWMDREADDGAAAGARYAWQRGDVPVLFSRDKDWRMIPARHVVWTTFDRVEVRPETWGLLGPDGELYGRKFFWMQMLMGDAADYIPGLEKQPAKEEGKFKTCGEGCAQDYLGGVTDEANAYAVVKHLYQQYYGASWPDRFVEQAALLWMRVDKKAYIGDFMRALPYRDEELEQALVRLERRVR